VLRSAKQASPVALALVFLTYILGIMAGLNDKVDFFKYFSPINYAIPSEVMDKGISGTNVMISCSVIIVMVAATFILYNKKDLKV
ncbi:ABC transporter permease subunit, partial [Salmonella enterica subsp. enterica serovar Typhimurium]